MENNQPKPYFLFFIYLKFFSYQAQKNSQQQKSRTYNIPAGVKAFFILNYLLDIVRVVSQYGMSASVCGGAMSSVGLVSRHLIPKNWRVPPDPRR